MVAQKNSEEKKAGPSWFGFIFGSEQKSSIEFSKLSNRIELIESNIELLSLRLSEIENNFYSFESALKSVLDSALQTINSEMADSIELLSGLPSKLVIDDTVESNN